MSIEADDRLHSIRIVRVGAEAEAFRPTTASVRAMIDEVRERVREQEADRAAAAGDYVLRTWPAARPGDGDWQYLVLEDGEGEPTASGDTISIRYTGHTTRGLNFASTGQGCAPWWPDAAQPSGWTCEYVVGEGSVTEGLDAALAHMRPGARWIVIVPTELGYPGAGYYAPSQPGRDRFVIRPGSVLIYEVEVMR